MNRLPTEFIETLRARVAVPNAGTTLPSPLPEGPFPLFKQWLDEEVAAGKVPNPNAMSLSTVAAGGMPSSRIVLCRGVDVAAGRITFFTNRTSRKGRELESGRCALCFHFDHTDRQVRVEGVVVQSPESESDAYWQSRRWESRLAAWASDQSESIASREALLSKLEEVVRRLDLDVRSLLERPEGVRIPRPPHWGGYRVYASAMELWLGGTGRLHDRARWERSLPEGGDVQTLETAAGASRWKGTRLQP